MSDDKYTPNMEKLKADLGRVPPTMVIQGKPEDFAPKPRPATTTPDAPGYVSPNYEAEMAQRIKTHMRESDGWVMLSWGEREALDEIASQIAGICVGRHFWDDVLESAEAGRTAKQEQ